MSLSLQQSVSPTAVASGTAENRLLYLSLKDTLDLLDPADVVRIAEETLLAHDAGAVIWSSPRMITLQGEPLQARFRAKLCAVTRLPAVGFRVVSSIPGSERLEGGPTRLVLLSDPETGEFRAIVDERWSFALRTGAGAAVAIKYLHGRDTTEVGLIGAGHMARGTIWTMKAALPNLARVYVTSRRAESRERLVEDLAGKLDVEIIPLATSEEVLSKADAVVVSTSAKEPFISESWLRPGCTIYSMGAQQELDTPSYRNVDKFIADDWGQVQLKADIVALAKRGEFGDADVYADLSEILSAKKPGRESRDERIFVRSEGLVTMDVALAHHLYTLALDRGLGQSLDARS
jgi:ornithine cyclodeaminase/alanine dehydrogenase-like protein (mu-crystallin family)